MRLLHPETIKIISTMDNEEFKSATVTKKQVLAHAWAEVFKFIGGNKSHPKMFLPLDCLGVYMGLLFSKAIKLDCNFDYVHATELFGEHFVGWSFSDVEKYDLGSRHIGHHFDDNYLFSDAVSLYFKGVNIFPYIFGDNWRKYIPVESLKEIQRQVDKTLERRND